MSNATQGSASNRINMLLDDNSFVEIGAGVTARATDFNIKANKTPSDGVVTGYGVIEGNLVYVYSQDAAVLGGSIGEMHAKKITKLYDLALKTGAPVIGLIDCSGLRLQESTDALNGFGELYAKQVEASGVIPQITAIFGNCGGGVAVIPALTDFTFMEEKNAKLFVNSPNALDGNYTAKCDTAGAKFQSEEAGLVDFVGTQEEILGGIRNLVTLLPGNNEDEVVYPECADDLNRLCENIDAVYTDAAYVLSVLADNGEFVEVKKNYAKSMVTGFIKLNGMTVGAVANRTEIFGEDGKAVEKFDACLTPAGCEKAADFVKFCDAFNIPVLTLTNVKGFAATVCSEKKIAKAVADMTYAFSNATVAKVNVIVGDAFGSAYVAMNSKSIGADMVFAWPNAKIGMMDASAAVKIMYADEIKASDDAVSLIAEKAAEYEKLQSNVDSAAARGYVDTVIEPAQTRKYLITAFDMLFTKREDTQYKKHGTV